MKNIIILSVFLGLCSINAQTTIYSQTKTSGSMISTALLNGNFFASADDFSITNQSTVKKIKVHGIQFDGTLETDTKGALLYIYSDNGGKPSGVPNITGTPITVIDIDANAVGYHLIKTDQNKYTFEIDISAQPNPLVLQPNTVYWLIFMPKMDQPTVTNSKRFDWFTGQVNGNPAQIVSSNNTFGVGSMWKNARELGGTSEFDGLAFSIEGETSLGVVEIYNSMKETAIYPNPVTDYVVMESNKKILSADVYDTSGKRIEVFFKENKVDIRSLPSGSYILKLKTQEGYITKKIIKK
ncbi:T9SS type A sorting domain-containing protein [Chryseobacterium sp.]|uniref:T9SS type A sorting domain-containing protein n=1 Tax=Chryseobacterium sp. TaxID=1871047 RepID=UPI0028A12C4D|nr:T9SS type A sorting domain-containing protein [Chryseobacterium sp.]